MRRNSTTPNPRPAPAPKPNRKADLATADRQPNPAVEEVLRYTFGES